MSLDPLHCKMALDPVGSSDSRRRSVLQRRCGSDRGLSSIRRNVGVTSLAQALGWVLGTITALIIPRYVGPETLGQVQLAWALWAIGGVLITFGSDQYLQLAIARENASGLQLMAPTAAARTLSFVMVSGAIASYIVIVGVDTTIASMAIVVGLSILIGQWSGALNAGFFGLERMSAPAVISIVFQVLGLIVTLGVVWLDLGIFGILWSGIALSVLSMLVMLWSFRRIAPIILRVSWLQIRTVVAGSLPFMVVGLALTVYRQIDIIVIAQMAGDRDLGWYAAADKLFGSLMFPTTLILFSVFPTFGRLHEHDPAGLRDLVRRTFSLLLLVSIPVGLGAAAVGPSFAPLLFGSSFSGTGVLLAILGPVTILTFGTTLLATLAVATDRRWFVATLLFASAALTVPLDLVLVPWASARFDNGAIGGALAFVVTEMLQFGFLLWYVAPYLVTREALGRTARVLAAGGIMLVAIWPIRDVFVVVPATVGAVVYIACILMLRALDEFQRSMLHDVTKSVGARLRRS